ncbi:carbonic anhydrase family protein [Breznakia pachnodae]|uniref:carbonic anhydrase n=1 Tax=Breznakia pachnodae TaxID=265178 RepID=A0ABU0E8H7_9FIRM|nr:carbonic anhydrase family protein [Breznakia pachnodae]MDQ0363213.1 carbonic anhydrase [Breznakia pachnodae]
MNKDIEWSYIGNNGPDYWGSLCHEYSIATNGMRQSPINIDSDNVYSATQSIDYHYEEDKYLIKSEKYTISLYPLHEYKQYFVYENEKFYLEHIHFHVPSEHTIDNKRFSVEWHFVHKNIHKEYLVLAILSDVRNNSISSFESLVTALNKKEKHLLLDISQLITNKVREFYHYEGSLTTPPTVESVTWIIGKQIISIGSCSYGILNKNVNNNVRPIQRINDRKIKMLCK